VNVIAQMADALVWPRVVHRLRSKLKSSAEAFGTVCFDDGFYGKTKLKLGSGFGVAFISDTTSLCWTVLHVDELRGNETLFAILQRRGARQRTVGQQFVFACLAKVLSFDDF
jgi:hypothetical protein